MQNISRHIALTLKSLRQERGWSLDKTAQETGVSKAMLGQIEREESNPTIAVLWKIAKGFHTSFSSFLKEPEAETIGSIYRSPTQDLNPAPDDDKIRVITLFHYDKQLKSEIFLIELLPGCEHLSAAHDPGVVEQILVVEGSMEVLLNGVWNLLHKGEAIRFKANQAHGYRNLTPETASFHNVIHYEIW